MSSSNKRSTVSALLGTNAPPPITPTKTKFCSPKSTMKEVAEKKRDKKHSFSSTITDDNKQRLANYQAHKPGGAHTTDVLNQALERFFDANKQYADIDLGEKS